MSLINTLSSADFIILGGTFTGMMASLELAHAGKSVTLIEPHTYLGTEITATLRPWLSEMDEIPEPLKTCLEVSDSQPFLGERPLHLDAVKKRLEDILLEAGVKLLYRCSPVRLIKDGLIIGSKGGLFHIACLSVLDARTPHRGITVGAEPGWGAISLEFEGTAFGEFGSLSNLPHEISLPESLQILGNRAFLHRGYHRSPNPYLCSHILVECRMELPVVKGNPLDYSQRYLYARKRAIAVAEHLLWEHPAFRLATLGKVAEMIYDPIMAESMQSTAQSLKPANSLPVADVDFPDWDVLVVGGGTSGAIAAIAASQEGARALLVEMNPGLGGTGTYGGVSAYWMGRQVGFSRLSQQWTDSLHDRLRFPRMHGVLPIWNIEAKTQALLEQAEIAGVELLIDTLVVDAVIEDGRVAGVIAVSPSGLIKLKAKVVVDATGDGDIAAFAGAEYTYGAKRDGRVMWYSLPQFKSPGRIQSNFSGMVDVTDPIDFTRAVIWGRRRGGALNDHGSYLAPRETRHIRGITSQRLADQLLGRAYPDVISLAMSNNDMKGHTSSDWMRVGLIPPNLLIEISYGMLLPQGLDGILVVGKAISAERDALPSIRMQPDLENLGGAAGVAAAFAVQQNVPIKEVDLSKVQKRLVEIGVLPSDILNRTLKAFQPTETDIQGWIEAIISNENPLWSISSMEVNEVYHAPVPFAALCCSGNTAVEAIKRTLSSSLSRETRQKLGRALALMGSPFAVEVLVEELQTLLSGGKLPEIEGKIRHAVKEAPDQAAMPEAVYTLYGLALTRDRRSLPIWERIVDLLADTSLEDIFSLQRGIFGYVDAVCSGAEQLSDPEAVPLLERLATYPAFSGHQHSRVNYPTGIHPDHLLERAAYLELVIGRALARCGSPRGALTLINFLSDARKLLAQQARSELVAISGSDFGYDVAAWVQWLESTSDFLKPVAWIPTLEAVSTWQDDIYVMW